ncbi:hypothetical protein BJF78_23055 [Pseudonocardia sp. CNS-139]|nr:hypothetical protein BJF78_23055 [Pseudonocardia sp. CNS-139]
MVRLTRAQQQERTRAAVLAAARHEFAEHGYADAKVDRIAERAELTRGAVYSNFPSKRALYLAVLVAAEEPAGPAPARPPGAAAALGAFARIRLERLPLTGDAPADGSLRLRSLTGVFDDEPGRTASAQVTSLEAVLLGLALEAVEPAGGRRVRLAELVLTLLAGSGHLAGSAPGFGDPFDVARACEHLAGLDLGDTWRRRTCRSSARPGQPRTRGRRPRTSPTRSPAGRSRWAPTVWSPCSGPAGSAPPRRPCAPPTPATC